MEAQHSVLVIGFVLICRYSQLFQRHVNHHALPKMDVCLYQRYLARAVIGFNLEPAILNLAFSTSLHLYPSNYKVYLADIVSSVRQGNTVVYT
jgi:hypothetical protein